MAPSEDQATEQLSQHSGNKPLNESEPLREDDPSAGVTGEANSTDKARFFLASIVDSSRDSIITIDFDGIITSWNKAAEELYGYAADEALGKPLTMLTLPRDLQQVLGNIDKIKLSRKVELFDTVRVHKNGREIYLEIVMALVRDDAGNVIGASAIARDVTERKRAEAALRENEQRLGAIFANAAIGMSEISLTGRFLRVSDELCKMLGRTRDELLGMGVADVTHPDDIPASFAAVRKVLETGQPNSLDKRYLKQSGSLIFANSNLTLLRDENGEPESLLVVTVDYTARKLAEDNLRESEERYRLLVEGTRDYAMFLMDPERRIVHWNSGAERLFGWPREEAIGLYGDMIFVPEEIAAGVPEEEVQIAIRDGAAPDIRWHRRKDGTRFWSEGVNTCLKDEDGTLRGFVKITRDATREKEADEALRLAHDELEQRVQERTAELQTEILQRHESDRARERLLQRVVSAQESERQRISLELHDQMGQQLTALLLGLQLLSAAPDSREQIERLTKLGKDIMDQMHHMARALRPAVLDTIGLQSALREYVGEWARQSGIEADLIVSGLAEPSRLRPEVETAIYRVVQESLTNVQRHAEATAVSVLLKRQDNTISVIVEDNGKGFEIALDEQGRPRQVTNRLGILGMQERLDLVSGTLTIESAPGAGTTLYVTVPIERRGEPRGGALPKEE